MIPANNNNNNNPIEKLGEFKTAANMLQGNITTNKMRGASDAITEKASIIKLRESYPDLLKPEHLNGPYKQQCVYARNAYNILIGEDGMKDPQLRLPESADPKVDAMVQMAKEDPKVMQAILNAKPADAASTEPAEAEGTFAWLYRVMVESATTAAAVAGNFFATLTTTQQKAAQDILRNLADDEGKQPPTEMKK